MALTATAGCAGRHTPAASAPALQPYGDYLDLQPGWRLRVVQGNPKFSAVTARGNDIELRAAEDFSYEISYYEVRSSRRGVRIRFSSAQAFRNGEPAPLKRSSRNLFQLPAAARFVRLLFLVRASQSDHDMAVLAADSPDRLTQLTASVRASAAACLPGARMSCEWIPNGVAVRAERQTPGSGLWSPVR